MLGNLAARLNSWRHVLPGEARCNEAISHALEAASLVCEPGCTMKKVDPQAMINAAITLIRAGGPDNVNVEAVALEGNASTGTLYNHFLSKTGLLAAAALDTLKAMEPIKEPALWLQLEPMMVEVLADIALSLSRKKPERIPEDIARDLLLLLACAPGQNDQWPVVFGEWLAARVQTALATHCQNASDKAQP